MPTSGRLDLGGLGDYLEELAKAGQDVDVLAAQALMVGAPVIAEQMVNLVPKDTHHLEGTIGVDGPYREGNFHYVDIGVITDDKDTAIYGNVQEFGSSSVEPQPYIRPGFRSRKARAMKLMKDFLKAAGLL